MAAYAIFIRESTTNHAELETYSQLAGATLGGHPANVLAAYGPQVVLEGPPVEGVVIVSFPTIKDAQTWYESPSYRQAREHRFKGANYRAIIVEGIPG